MFAQVGSAYRAKRDPTGRFLLCNIPRKWTDVPESRIGRPGRRLDRGELLVCGDKGARCGGVRAATGFLYAKGAMWQYAPPADRRKGAEPLTEAAV